MTCEEIMSYLESKGSEQTRKIYTNHGAKEPFFGVKVSDLKPIEKAERNNQKLAKELYATGNGDAQYLAGLIANPSEFTEEELMDWAQQASWYMVAEYAVAWNLAEHPNCLEIALKWIEDEDAALQVVAWAGLSAHVITKFSDGMKVAPMEALLKKIEREIHLSENRVRYTMNGFVIAAAAGFPELTASCKELGDRIGKVEVSLGKTACKVPSIRPYIENMENRGRIGKKKAKAKC